MNKDNQIKILRIQRKRDEQRLNKINTLANQITNITKNVKTKRSKTNK